MSEQRCQLRHTDTLVPAKVYRMHGQVVVARLLPVDAALDRSSVSIPAGSVDSVVRGLSIAPPNTCVMAQGVTTRTALAFLGRTAEPVEGSRLAVWQSIANKVAAGSAVLLLMDRFTLGNAPWAILRPGRFDPELDQLSSAPTLELVRIDGLVTGILFRP